MKKFLSGLIVGLLVSVSLTAFAVQLKVVPNPFPVFINGDKAQVDAYNINGSTYLKLSDLKTAGLDVKFADSKINIASSVKDSGSAHDVVKTNNNIDGFKIYQVDGKDCVRISEIFKYCNEQYEKNQTNKKVFFYLKTKSSYPQTTQFYIEKQDWSVSPRVVTTVDLFSIKLSKSYIDIDGFKEYFQPIINLSLEDIYNSKIK